MVRQVSPQWRESRSSFPASGSFDAAGGKPGAEFAGGAGVEILHHGVEVDDLLLVESW